jgi:hypothetical protein
MDWSYEIFGLLCNHSFEGPKSYQGAFTINTNMYHDIMSPNTQDYEHQKNIGCKKI